MKVTNVNLFLNNNPKMPNYLANGSIVLDGRLVVGDIAVEKVQDKHTGENIPVVSMPRYQDKNGEWKDKSFPLNRELREEINKVVLSKYDEVVKNKNVVKAAEETKGAVSAKEAVSDVGNKPEMKVTNVNLFLNKNPKMPNLLANASITVNGQFVVGDIHVAKGFNKETGLKKTFVSMPQYRDKNGEWKDKTFPLDKELREEINNAVLNKYDEVVEICNAKEAAQAAQYASLEEADEIEF
jgi:stage V sporulation protein G